MTYQPFHLHNEASTSRWVLCCDHATNVVPQALASENLGLPATEMQRHIAFDPGAAAVTKALADLWNAPAITSNFSRLVVDPNRGIDDPTLFMQLYDGSAIPSNRGISAENRTKRLETCYRPYHEKLSALMSARPDPILLSIHSFTPQLRGRDPRPWEVGVLYSHLDNRLAQATLRTLNKTELNVGDNEPYTGHLPGDTLARHALAHGHPNVLIELRQDLLKTADQQIQWAQRLASILDEALSDAQL